MCLFRKLKKQNFLGVIINELLRWTSHVSTIKQKVTENLGIIRHITVCTENVIFNSDSTLCWILQYCMVYSQINFFCWIDLPTEIYPCYNKLYKWNAHTQSLFYKTRILPLDKLLTLCWLKGGGASGAPHGFSAKNFVRCGIGLFALIGSS